MNIFCNKKIMLLGLMLVPTIALSDVISAIDDVTSTVVETGEIVKDTVKDRVVAVKSVFGEVKDFALEIWKRKYKIGGLVAGAICIPIVAVKIGLPLTFGVAKGVKNLVKYQLYDSLPKNWQPFARRGYTLFGVGALGTTAYLGYKNYNKNKEEALKEKRALEKKVQEEKNKEKAVELSRQKRIEEIMQNREERIQKAIHEKAKQEEERMQAELAKQAKDFEQQKAIIQKQLEEEQERLRIAKEQQDAQQEKIKADRLRAQKGAQQRRPAQRTKGNQRR